MASLTIRGRSATLWLALTLVLALCGSGYFQAGGAGAAGPRRPRLAVLVVFDQMRGDYLERWDKLFGEGGFHRLEREGTWFQNCNYPYAITATGPGHASLGTGCTPAKHGIIGNDWYDRAGRKVVYCAATIRGGSPERLLMPTLGDTVKLATGGKGRVVSLSYKDRSAVLPAGRAPDACYWVKGGNIVTSPYYRDAPHAWVEEYNRSGMLKRWQARQWTRLRPDLDYTRYSGPDDVVGEGSGYGQGRVFPHPFPVEGRYYDAVYNSPFGNEFLLGLAKRAIDAEQLGRRGVVDFLNISFSSNDIIGHTWGPDSQEVLDVTLRSDLIVKELLDYLDSRVGRGNYVLALSADHGVCPLPEVTRSRGKDAARVPDMRGQIETFLSAKFGKNEGRAHWIESLDGLWIYLNYDVIRGHGLKNEVVEDALAGWLRAQQAVAKAYTRTELLRGVTGEDAIGQSVRRSFYPDRCGDVGVVLKPYYLSSAGYTTGTNHGTPYEYDTHVPLLVLGPGIRHDIRRDAVTPQAATIILAHALGIKPPSGAEYGVPERLFEPK